MVIDGCPPRVPLTLDHIQTELDRRRPGQSDITTPRKEADRAEILSGEPQVLAAAIDLVNGGTIRQVEVAEVEYFHLLFDAHQIVWSNAVPSESLHVSRNSVASLRPEQRHEIATLFPELLATERPVVAIVRPTLRPFEARILAELRLG